ncbi:hypothetical protein F5X98DRAFT_358025 [Xylaria grammica]|nr:hypothetical protein F5X98DRAFT_358025 [Xylaria grammica]
MPVSCLSRLRAPGSRPSVRIATPRAAVFPRRAGVVVLGHPQHHVPLACLRLQQVAAPVVQQRHSSVVFIRMAVAVFVRAAGIRVVFFIIIITITIIVIIVIILLPFVAAPRLERATALQGREVEDVVERGARPAGVSVREEERMPLWPRP